MKTPKPTNTTNDKQEQRLAFQLTMKKTSLTGILP